MFERPERDERPWFLFHGTAIPHPPNAMDSLNADPRATLVGYRDGHVETLPGYGNLKQRTA
ncbi:MAG: hypothetical protein AAF333_11895 [Planctomycetota bacterium]